VGGTEKKHEIRIKSNGLETEGNCVRGGDRVAWNLHLQPGVVGTKHRYAVERDKLGVKFQKKNQGESATWSEGTKRFYAIGGQGGSNRQLLRQGGL